MQTTKSHCLMKSGHRRKSDSMTHLPWKAIPLKPHLQKGSVFRRNWKIVLNEGVEGKISQRLVFLWIEAHSSSTIQRTCLKVPDKEISQSIQHHKEGKILNNNLMNTRSTPIRFTIKLYGNSILSPSSSSSSQWAAEQWMEVENQSSVYWRSSTWTEKIFLRSSP